jgi:dienelactone hydrolase
MGGGRRPRSSRRIVDADCSVGTAVKSFSLGLQSLWIVVLVVAQPVTAAPGVVFQTSVAPQFDEDLASACRYEITLTDPSRTVKGVWVIFDRGRDMLRYYGDPDVQRFAQLHDWALLLPFHCAAKSYSALDERGDMNMDPGKGIGRALFAALTQLAQSSHHPELASSKLILLGFSGTGSLVGRLAGYAPDRVLAVIATGPGHFDPLGVDTITLSPQAAAIPELIITGSADAISGTRRPYAYFRRYFDQGAPWTFIVQNKTPHCCIINAKALALQWLDAVVIQHLTRTSGWYGFIKTVTSETADCPAPYPPADPIWCRGTKDSWGGDNWSVSAATMARRPDPPREMIPAGWLPTRAFAKKWLTFVTQPEHPITSLP